MKIVFTANGRCASAAVEPAGQPITAGSRGVPAEIHLSPDYDGLVVTAFFRSEYGAWPVVLGETPGTVTIPWEAMEKKSLTFDVGVVGKNGDGTIVIPTIWARAGKIVPATEDSGLEPGDPSADIGAQIVEQARAAAKKAEDAAEAAEEARDKMPRIVDGTWRVYNAVTESWEDTGIQAEGQDGVGISDAILNADYTLTLTFTDGSSYTTPPIRGRQGERGPIGPTPDISIGTVTTGAAGSQAEATMTGTPENPVLNLTIPRGDPGEVTQAEFDDLADEVAQQKSAIDNVEASLATVETTSTASRAYAVGELLVYGNRLYKVASVIAAGSALTPGTNLTPVTVAGELDALAQDIDNIQTFKPIGRAYFSENIVTNASYIGSNRALSVDGNHILLGSTGGSTQGTNIFVLSNRYRRFVGTVNDFRNTVTIDDALPLSANAVAMIVDSYVKRATDPPSGMYADFLNADFSRLGSLRMIKGTGLLRERMAIPTDSAFFVIYLIGSNSNATFDLWYDFIFERGS